MSRYSTVDSRDGSIVNVHHRVVRGSLEQAAELLTGLGTPDDAAWPADRWQPMVLDRGHAVGSRGGHGSVRYTVVAAEPGRSLTFEFDAVFPAVGGHRLEIEAVTEDSVLWRHTLWIAGPLSPLMRLVVLLHDACLEDLLDQVEAAMEGRPVVRERWALDRRAAVWIDELLERRPEPREQRRARRPVGWAVAGALTALAGLHAAWGAGVTWPAAEPSTLARAVTGHERMPGPVACAAVAAALSATAGLVVVRLGDDVGRGRLPFGIVDAAVRSAALVLAGRGAAGLLSSTIGRPRSTPPYRTLDLAAYSPLCLALAGALRYVTDAAPRTGRSALTRRMIDQSQPPDEARSSRPSS